MTAPTSKPAMPSALTPTQWLAFDEFVHLIGSEDRWRSPVPTRARATYRTLAFAGLLIRRMGSHGMYRLTGAGRREACARSSHDFDRNRPEADGCQMCDAVVCSACMGAGLFCDPTGASERTDDCEACDGTGVRITE